MATRKIGARVEIDGEKEYKEAISAMNSANKVLESEMRKLQAEYQGNTESIEFLTEKGDLLQRQLLSQKEKVEELKKALQNSAAQSGESSRATMEWQKKLNDAEAEVYRLEHAIDENNEAMQTAGEEMTGLGDTLDQLGQKFGVSLPADMKTALNGVEGFSAGAVAAMAAAAAAVAALVAVFKELNDITIQVAADADEYLTQSAITSVPTELLQAWDYAAQFVDVSADTITGSMTKITQAMGDAAGGSDEAKQKFADLGVSITDSEGQLRSAQDVFSDVIDALGGIENQTERDAAAMALMGKSAQDLNPLINAGSEALEEYGKQAQEVGYILSEDELKALGEVDDEYQKMNLTIDAAWKKIALDFAPGSKAAMELFADVVQKAGNYLDESGLVENLAAVVQSVAGLIRAGTDLFDNLPKWMNPLQQLSDMFRGLAVVVATVADSVNVISGLAPWNWGSGKARTALGWNIGEGQMSNLQTLMRSGSEYVSYNAGGSDNWRGGMTWVGEAGPELVSLPKGSQILNAQDSRVGGDTFYITIDAASVKEFNDIVEMAQSARVRQRMR